MADEGLKIKDMPPKEALEVTDDDVLIIEDENNTCHIKIQDLKTFLFGCSSLQEYIDNVLNPIIQRMELAESLYPFKLETVSIPLISDMTELDTEIFANNQSKINATFSKVNMYTYKIDIEETENLEYYNQITNSEENNKWIALVLYFNKNSCFINYNNEHALGEWAENYSLDNNLNVYRYGAINDLPLFRVTDNKALLMWFATDKGSQNISFIDENDNVIDVIINFQVLPDITEEDDVESTYTVYEPDVLNANVTITNDTVNGKTFNIEYTDDIPYIQSFDNTVLQSGNWVTLKITPPTGYTLPELKVDNITMDLTDYDNPITYDVGYKYNVVDNEIYLDLLFSDTKSGYECTFSWGNEYIDIVEISHSGNLLYP